VAEVAGEVVGEGQLHAVFVPPAAVALVDALAVGLRRKLPSSALKSSGSQGSVSRRVLLSRGSAG
jgi:hypothetical protein